MGNKVAKIQKSLIPNKFYANIICTQYVLYTKKSSCLSTSFSKVHLNRRNTETKRILKTVNSFQMILSVCTHCNPILTFDMDFFFWSHSPNDFLHWKNAWEEPNKCLEWERYLSEFWKMECENDARHIFHILVHCTYFGIYYPKLA